MNRQRWLALVVAVGVVGVLATSNLWLPALSRQQTRPTVTPNSSDFVAVIEGTPTASFPVAATRALGTPPTLDPVVAGLIADAGIQTLAVGDQPFVIMAGDFTTVDELHRADGTASLYKIGNVTYVLRLDSFSVSSGPDLHVLLSPQLEPRTSAEALLPSYLDLGPLKSATGSQNYEVPNNINLARYHSVVIYSLSLNLVYSSATLTQVRG